MEEKPCERNASRCRCWTPTKVSRNALKITSRSFSDFWTNISTGMKSSRMRFTMPFINGLDAIAIMNWKFLCVPCFYSGFSITYAGNPEPQNFQCPYHESRFVPCRYRSASLCPAGTQTAWCQTRPSSTQTNRLSFSKLNMTVFRCFSKQLVLLRSVYP